MLNSSASSSSPGFKASAEVGRAAPDAEATEVGDAPATESVEVPSAEVGRAAPEATEVGDAPATESIEVRPFEATEVGVAAGGGVRVAAGAQVGEGITGTTSGAKVLITAGAFPTGGAETAIFGEGVNKGRSTAGDCFL